MSIEPRPDHSRSRVSSQWPWLLSVGLAALLAAPVQADDPPKPKPLNVFTGRVLHPDGQTPVAGAKVHVAESELGFITYGGPDEVFTYAPEERLLLIFRRRNGRRSGDAVTDENGRFKIKGLKAGDYSLLAVHESQGIAVREKISQPNADKPVDVVLSAPAYVEPHIKGLEDEYYTVESDAWMESRISFHLFTPSGFQSDGVTMRALPPGMGAKVGPLPAGDGWKLKSSSYVEKNNYSATLLEIPVAVRAGETTRLEMDLNVGERVAGRVVGPDGKPLNGVNVMVATKADPPARYGAVTDKDGRYTLRGLSPGEYLLEAKRWQPRTAPG